MKTGTPARSRMIRKNPILTVSVYLICLYGVNWSHKISLISDIQLINTIAVAANSTGIIILGGGVAKHHVCNANAWVNILH